MIRTRRVGTGPVKAQEDEVRRQDYAQEPRRGGARVNDADHMPHELGELPHHHSGRLVVHGAQPQHLREQANLPPEMKAAPAVSADQQLDIRPGETRDFGGGVRHVGFSWRREGEGGHRILLGRYLCPHAHRMMEQNEAADMVRD